MCDHVNYPQVGEQDDLSSALHQYAASFQNLMIESNSNSLDGSFAAILRPDVDGLSLVLLGTTIPL